MILPQQFLPTSQRKFGFIPVQQTGTCTYYV